MVVPDSTGRLGPFKRRLEFAPKDLVGNSGQNDPLKPAPELERPGGKEVDFVPFILGTRPHLLSRVPNLSFQTKPRVVNDTFKPF